MPTYIFNPHLVTEGRRVVVKYVPSLVTSNASFIAFYSPQTVQTFLPSLNIFPWNGICPDPYYFQSNCSSILKRCHPSGASAALRDFSHHCFSPTLVSGSSDSLTVISDVHGNCKFVFFILDFLWGDSSSWLSYPIF
jgi:hypothetical protein